jgi:SAM-dependent methyltransferase
VTVGHESQPGVILSEALTAEQIADGTRRDRLLVQTGPGIDLRYYFDHCWVDDRSVFLRGFLFIPDRHITAFCYLLDDARVEILRSPRPDLTACYGDSIDAERAGFQVLMPFRAGMPILLEVTTALGVTRLSLVLAGRSKVSHPTDSAYVRLVQQANRPGARILEIGSRVVGPLSEPRAGNFPSAARFIGVDIHPGRGVDVVCDAHTLSSVFRPGSFDYVFSLSVLEHLPAPWLVAVEVNQVLAMGGLVMKSVPFAFPLHETPNDFWRFSDKGLEQLFGPAFGFEVIESGMACEMRLIPEWRDLLADVPLNPGFGEAWIFSRKVADCRPESVFAAGPATQRSRHYPTPLAGTAMRQDAPDGA